MEALKKQIGVNQQTRMPANLLAVDDDDNMLKLLSTYLEGLGHNVVTAINGREAYNYLQTEKNNFDVVLLDQMMPEMQGLEVVSLMKQDADLKHIPVIMLTGASRPAEIKKGIDAGVYYYLTKPINSAVLNSVLSAAIRDAQYKNALNAEIKHQLTSFRLIKKCSFEFSTLQEAESLACFVANCYPDAKRVVTGLAELLTNAVEHGNLQIGYDKKTELLDNNNWRAEVIRRAELPENKGKFVDVKLQRNDDGIYVTITDQGQGFEWHKYMEVDPARAQDNHGRGIAQANAMCFDRITFNEKGNQVTAFAGHDSEIDW